MAYAGVSNSYKKTHRTQWKEKKGNRTREKKKRRKEKMTETKQQILVWNGLDSLPLTLEQLLQSHPPGFWHMLLSELPNKGLYGCALQEPTAG